MHHGCYVIAVSVMDSSCHDSSMAVCVTTVRDTAVYISAVHVLAVWITAVRLLGLGLSVLGLFSDFFPTTTFDFLSDSN